MQEADRHVPVERTGLKMKSPMEFRGEENKFRCVSGLTGATPMTFFRKGNHYETNVE